MIIFNDNNFFKYRIRLSNEKIKAVKLMRKSLDSVVNSQRKTFLVPVIQKKEKIYILTKDNKIFYVG